MPVLPGGGTINSSGVAVGFAIKNDPASSTLGNRAVRWDASGASALGDLGTASWGGGGAMAFAINAGGTAVGYSDKFPVTPDPGVTLNGRAVRWNPSDSAAVELGNLGTTANGNTTARAYAVNDAGTAVGWANKFFSGASKGNRAVRWDASGTAATELGDLGTTSTGVSTVQAWAINAAGTAVGYGNKYDGSGVDKGMRGIRWDPGGIAATELGTLGTDGGGSTTAWAYAINTAGTAVGFATKYNALGFNRGNRAVRWGPGSTAATELGTITVDLADNSSAEAYAINTAGTAVGFAQKYDDTGTSKGRRAVRWDASGTAATELPNLGTTASGFTNSFAYAINGAGIAVGQAAVADSSGELVDDHAVYWTAEGAIVDLNTLIDASSGWTLQSAKSISETNWIAGYGRFDPDGPGGEAAYRRLFSLQLPEPSFLPPLGLAVIALARRARRGGISRNDP